LSLFFIAKAFSGVEAKDPLATYQIRITDVCFIYSGSSSPSFSLGIEYITDSSMVVVAGIAIQLLSSQVVMNFRSLRNNQAAFFIPT